MPIRTRVVRPERLDALEPDDPAALASRRDLQRINRLGGALRWWRRHLPRLLAPADRVLELGAGDGRLCAAMRPLLPAGTRWTGLDLRPVSSPVPGGPDTWLVADAFGTLPGSPSVVIANLLLHHAQDAALANLGRQLVRDGGPRAFLAVETRRSRFGKAWFLLGAALLRFHPVTRHDGAVSLDAGFRPGELASLLGLDAARWRVRESFPGPGLIAIEATRLP